MDLKAILDEWSVDSKIDDHKLDETSRDTPKLHAKYLQWLAEAKLAKKREEFKQKTLLKHKWLWYNGKMSEEQIRQLGWDYDPLDGLKIMKGEMDYYYDSDPEIQKSEEKVQYWKTIVETLTEIITNLNWRHQTIGNIIRWKQFEAGT
ncbi:MAG TPA: hypothetical protein DCW83_01490 [Saprospirales bacterium]|jgi:hypothetical protein|nr:hypothetical protein [Saprospirales bacterium]|tara:strand:+ start:255 stop:698 length:444 start_codon:yes stop_codon:yes gene_type:complete